MVLSAMQMTAHQKTADALLRSVHGKSLTDFIQTRRDDGQSYRQITRDLYEATGGGVDVTLETVRDWAVRLGIHKTRRAAS